MTQHLPWLALSRLPGIGPITVRRWLEQFKTIDNLFTAKESDWKSVGFTTKQMHALKNPDWKKAEQDLCFSMENKCELITLVDKRYPILLKEIYDPPLLLYVQGDASLLAEPQIAMIGSRNPSITGKEIAEQFARDLASAGWIITSGLAMGIDSASHRGALKTGKTIAVMGAGLQHIYPRSNQTLAKEIIKNGALVTEFPHDTLPKSFHFPMRNRIISGLSKGVLVVEAAIQSGSLITARLALEQNRDVFAIPGSIHNLQARGCHQLLRQGAKLVENVSDILEEIGFCGEVVSIKSEYIETEEAVDLDPSLKRVLAHIGYEVTALESILVRSGLTMIELSSMLLSLELKGYVRSVSGGYARS